MNINPMTFAARDFSLRRGASDAHIPPWICKERATKSGRKGPAALRVAPNLACGFVARRLQPHYGGCSLLAPDTVSRVIRPSARRAHESSPQPMVNNSAAKNDLRPVKVNAGRIALRGSRSFAPRLMKTMASLPAPSAAAVTMSERTTACEAPCIRMTADSAAVRATKGKVVKPFNEITHYAGFDWARDHHDVVLVDRQGQIVADFRIEHSLAGWQQFRDKIKDYPALGVAIETSQGAAVDQLLQLDCSVYPVNPLRAKSYRERKAPSGNKTDHLDGWSLAEALRTDGHSWKALRPLDPLTQQLQLLCRDEISLIEQRTALVNQLQQALVEYYPAAIQAFEDWTLPACWDFILQFPTPEKLAAAGRRRWEKFLHTQKLW